MSVIANQRPQPAKALAILIDSYVCSLLIRTYTDIISDMQSKVKYTKEYNCLESLFL